MGVGSAIQRWFGASPPSEERAFPQISLDEWAQYFSFQGNSYPLFGQSLSQGREEIGADYAGLVEGAYKASGVVFACMLVRLLLFSEARFQYRRLTSGRPGDLFGSRDLAILERPWPNGTTGDLLTRAIQDADLAGNFYGLRDGDRLRRLRPDWVSIVLGSEQDAAHPGWAADAEVLGYVYHPGGAGSGAKPMALLAEDVCHFAPIPDPAARFRGMSWITPVIREIMADSAATMHKLQFFENGATPNLVAKFDPNTSKEAFDLWVAAYEERHEGASNAYRTLFLGGGVDVQVVGADMKQIDFKVTQGAGETRIAAAAGVPPVIVGLSEGLSSATYSNYSQARRRFADGTMRPLWRNMAGSLASVVNVPPGAELWYDDRDIPFLAEDQKDAAEIAHTQADTIHLLIAAGFEPDSVVAAVVAGDYNRLGHTGMVSVQLMPPGTVGEGKGAVVQGVPTAKPQKQLPAKAASLTDLLNVLARAEPAA